MDGLGPDDDCRAGCQVPVLGQRSDKGAYPRSLRSARAILLSGSLSTQVWPKGEFPMRKIAKFTLNENPENYFSQVRLGLLGEGWTTR